MSDSSGSLGPPSGAILHRPDHGTASSRSIRALTLVCRARYRFRLPVRCADDRAARAEFPGAFAAGGRPGLLLEYDFAFGVYSAVLVVSLVTHEAPPVYLIAFRKCPDWFH